MGSGNFRGALPLTEVYVGGCFKECTEDDLKEYCSNQLKIKIIDCVDLKSKSEQAKSFQIKVDVKTETILNGELWPENVYVRKFFIARQGRNNNTQNVS